MNEGFEIGYQFKQPHLLALAMTHKSFHYESRKDSSGHNEKVEFLGDAVLDLVLSELLMERFPEDGEGNLSKKRASLVNENVLAQVSKKLNLADRLQLGKGELLTGGGAKPRLMASVYEALVGAIFLDGGFEAARVWIRPHFSALLENMNPADNFNSDFKTRLQEEVQAVLKETPQYRMAQEHGPSHNRTFFVELLIRGRVLSSASGRTKKSAEQEAARLALEIWSKAKGELK